MNKIIFFLTLILTSCSSIFPKGEVKLINNTSKRICNRPIIIEDGGLYFIYKEDQSIKLLEYDQYLNFKSENILKNIINCSLDYSREYRAVLKNGDFINIGVNYNENNNSYLTYQKFFRLKKNTSEIMKNINNKLDLDEPSISVFNDGRFVLSYTARIRDKNSTHIYVQKYNSNLTPNGEPIKISKEFDEEGYINNDEVHSSITTGNNNDFAVIWQSYKITNDDKKISRIYYRKFDWNDKKIFNEIKVNDFIPSKSLPKILINNEQQVITVTQMYTNYTDTLVNIYNSENNIINSFLDNLEGHQDEQSIAMDKDGNFIVTWVNNNDDIFARKFDKKGNPLGIEFMVSETKKNSTPFVSVDQNGDFIIFWFNQNLRSFVFKKFDKKGKSL